MPWDKKTANRIEEESLELLECATDYADWYYNRKTGEFLSGKFLTLTQQNGFKDIWAIPDPILNQCSFFVGYWCGKGKDLICIIPSLLQETNNLDPYLSPSGQTPNEAINLALKAQRKC